MIGVPKSSDQIPVGTGLVQSVDCLGIQSRFSKEFNSKPQPLIEPVTAQIVTFADGMRHVCCPFANDLMQNGEYQCHAGSGDTQETCIYSWQKRKSDVKK